MWVPGWHWVANVCHLMVIWSQREARRGQPRVIIVVSVICRL